MKEYTYEVVAEGRTFMVRLTALNKEDAEAFFEDALEVLGEEAGFEEVGDVRYLGSKVIEEGMVTVLEEPRREGEGDCIKH